jgi:ABC-type Zn2+ transport system substrate-binding protein/surface adhesin
MVERLGDEQPTSAVKAAELVWQLGHCSFPPLRLLLGSYAVESVRDRLRTIIEEIEDWKHLSFPPAPDGFRGKREDENEEEQDDDDDMQDDDNVNRDDESHDHSM